LPLDLGRAVFGGEEGRREPAREPPRGTREQIERGDGRVTGWERSEKVYDILGALFHHPLRIRRARFTPSAER